MANRVVNGAISKVSALYNSIVTNIGQSAYFTRLLRMAEDKTGIPSSYIATGLTTAILLFIGLGFGPIIMFDLVVVLYPAYKSFHALENGDSDKLKYWMKYWIVFGFFRTTEHIGDSLFWWIPGYLILKFFFLLWCLAPVENNGSVVIYENYIRETFMQNKETVDDAIAAVRSLTSHVPVQLDEMMHSNIR